MQEGRRKTNKTETEGDTAESGRTDTEANVGREEGLVVERVNGVPSAVQVAAQLFARGRALRAARETSETGAEEESEEGR